MVPYGVAASAMRIRRTHFHSGRLWPHHHRCRGSRRSHTTDPPPRQHDHETSSSGAQQPTDAWDTAAFWTQPPSTYTSDPWETDPSQANKYDPWPDSYRRSTGTMQADMHVDHSDYEEDIHVDHSYDEDPPEPQRKRVHQQRTRVQPPRACEPAPRLSLSGPPPRRRR